MAYLNLDSKITGLSLYPRDFNGEMSLVLTAMLARDYLGKYANIREAYSGYYDKSRGSLPRNSETFFASFFGHKKGRSCG